MHRRSPTVRRRLLSIELRTLREDSGQTVTQVAKRLNWHPSKLTRAERNEWRLPEISDVATLLDLYGVTDPRREELLGIAREARQRGWWFAYRGVSDQYSTYIGLEAAASKIQNYEPSVVPGLLQTPAYARALMRGRRPDVPDEEIELLAAVRQERQSQLITDTTDPVDLWVVLGEAALRNLVGGYDVMLQQLGHLDKMARLGRVKLIIVPFSAGALPGTGPFVLMTFPEFLGPQAGYLETTGGPIWVEEDAALNRFRFTFETLVVAGAKGLDTIRLISAVMADLRSARDRAYAATMAQEHPQ
jgi:hypothetical protein